MSQDTNFENNLGRLLQNPFMITSYQSYGLNLNEMRRMNDAIRIFDKKELESNMKQRRKDRDLDLSFLYARESDKIGQEVKLSEGPLAVQLRKKLPRRKRTNNSTLKRDENEKNTIPNKQIVQILEQYNHEPKSQHPLYQTSSNLIGLKAPSLATYPSKMYSRSQSFSKSFNEIMFRDHGLNTSKAEMNTSDFHFT